MKCENCIACLPYFDGRKTQLRCSIGEGNDGSVRCGLKRKTIIKRLKEKYKLDIIGVKDINEAMNKLGLK